MEKYLGDEEPDRRGHPSRPWMGTIVLAFVPVLCGSVLKNKGVQPDARRAWWSTTCHRRSTSRRPRGTNIKEMKSPP